MADVKISQLLLFTPELTDTLIVNDVSQVTTKRATIQSLRDLANQNIDDTLTGSKITGTLEVTGEITDGTCTIPNICEIVTETELEELLGLDPVTGLITTLKCIRDSAPTISNFDCGIKILGETTIDSDLYVRGDLYVTGGLEWSGIASGDGTNIINIQYAEEAGLANIAIRAYRADSASYADSAGVAKYADSAGVTKQIRVINEIASGERYLTFTQFSTGVDSVRTDPQLTYDFGSGILSSQFFSGDGSLLTNISADVSVATSSKEVDAKLNNDAVNQYIMFRTLSAGFDSTYTDGNLLYNPNINLISGGASVTDLSLFGIAEGAKKTYSNDISIDGTYYLTMKANGTSLDSVHTSTGLTYASATETLSASFFSGNGSALTNVNALTSGQAATVAVTSAIDDANYFVSFVDTVTGNLSSKVNSGLRVNPSEPALQLVSDTARLTLGADSDLKIYHNGTDAYIDTITGGIRFQNSAIPAADTVIVLDGIPTSDPVNAGQLWNDAGTLKISAG